MEEVEREIERRFLVKKLPDGFESAEFVEIKQGYLAITSDREVRLRKVCSNDSPTKYFMTVKVGVGEERLAPEEEITKDFFEKFWPCSDGFRISKTRYFVHVEYYSTEVDFFHGKDEDHRHVEVEFLTDAECKAFVPPDWFGKEVTDDPRYNSRSIALYGVPKEEVQPVEAIIDNAPGVPRYDLDEGIKKAVDLICEKMSAKGDNILVNVAGGSASGKTSKVAVKIEEEIGPAYAEVRSLDNYYRGIDFMEEMKKKGTPITWDDPLAVELSLAREHLIQAKNGKAVNEPFYDFKMGLRAGIARRMPKKVMIIEGLFALHEELVDIADIKIFVDIGLHGRMMRRLLRDVVRTNWKPGDILKYFADVVEPIHEKEIEVTKKNADLIIVNEYNPNVEAGKSGLHEIQVKFKAILDEEFLRKKGAERLGSVHQLDTYYNPAGLDLVKRGEMIRIREENNYHILTYKGPKCDVELCKRPKFEFPIDADTAKIFVSMYGDEVTKIEKTRVLYQMEGIIIAADDVQKIIHGVETKLGNFIEIRSTDHEEKSEEKIISAVETLGLDMASAITESYVEF